MQAWEGLSLREMEMEELDPPDWETFYQENPRNEKKREPTIVPPDLQDSAAALTAEAAASNLSTRPRPPISGFIATYPLSSMVITGTATFFMGTFTPAASRGLVRVVRSTVARATRRKMVPDNAFAHSQSQLEAAGKSSGPRFGGRSHEELKKELAIYDQNLALQRAMRHSWESRVIDFGKTMAFSGERSNATSTWSVVSNGLVRTVKGWIWGEDKSLLIDQAVESESEAQPTQANPQKEEEEETTQAKTHLLPKKPVACPLLPPRPTPLVRSKPIGLQDAVSVLAVETHLADHGFIEDHGDLPRIADPARVEFRILHIPRGRPPHKFQLLPFEMKVKGGDVLHFVSGTSSSGLTRKVARLDHLYELHAKYYRANGEHLLVIDGEVWECKRDMRKKMLYPVRKVKREEVEDYRGVGPLRGEIGEVNASETASRHPLPRFSVHLKMSNPKAGAESRPEATAPAIAPPVASSAARQEHTRRYPPALQRRPLPPSNFARTGPAVVPIRYSRTHLAQTGVPIRPNVNIPYTASKVMQGAYILKLEGKAGAREGRWQAWSGVLMEEKVKDGIGMDDDAYLPNLKPFLRQIISASSVFVKVESNEIGLPKSVWVERFGPAEGFEMRATNDGVYILHPSE